MTLRLPTLSRLSILLCLPAFLVAQTSSSEEERLEKLMQDAAYQYVPKDTVKIGFRVLNSSGSVKYSNLGIVPATFSIPDLTKIEGRQYNNGSVSVDSLRANEQDANGNQVPPNANGRYSIFSTTTTNVTDADGNIIGTTTTTTQTGDYVSYVSGRTRTWSYQSGSQVTADGHVGMSIYSATSDGGFAEKKVGASGGVEFQLNHDFGKISNRVEWGLTAGVALNGINNKTSGTVLSTLNTYTDYYSLNGAPAPTAPYSGPVYTDIVDAATGAVVSTGGHEDTTTLSAQPDSHTNTSTTGGVEVNGKWHIKGAYFMMKVGPSLRAQLTERLGLTASIGVAGAYAGTTYSVVENFAVPNLTDTSVATPDPEQNTANKFLSGYYADLNLEWAANERTGLFTGLSAQKLSDYDQSLNGRIAHIDLGNSVGIRGGISFRF